MTTARSDRRTVDLEARRRAVADVVHSAELEGGRITPDTRADMADYEAGLIDADEVVRRTRARYNAR